MLADFVRYVRRPLSRRERALIERFERQRLRTHRVRAYVHDPYGRMVRVVCEYVRWHQQRLTRKDAIIVTAKAVPVNSLPSTLSSIPRASILGARRYLHAIGGPRCVGQVVLFGADMYCPSVPMYRNYLDRMLSLMLPMMSGRDSIFIVCGNADHRRTRFRNAWREWLARTGEAAFFEALDLTALPDAPRLREGGQTEQVRQVVRVRPARPARRVRAVGSPWVRGRPCASETGRTDDKFHKFHKKFPLVPNFCYICTANNLP